MDEDDDRRARRCDGKFRHPSRGQAEGFALVTLRIFGDLREVYFCEFCSGYHTGKPLCDSRRERKMRKAEWRARHQP